MLTRHHFEWLQCFHLSAHAQIWCHKVLWRLHLEASCSNGKCSCQYHWPWLCWDGVWTQLGPWTCFSQWISWFHPDWCPGKQRVRISKILKMYIKTTAFQPRFARVNLDWPTYVGSWSTQRAGMSATWVGHSLFFGQEYRRCLKST